jgi:hypothetical protein
MIETYARRYQTDGNRVLFRCCAFRGRNQEERWKDSRSWRRGWKELSLSVGALAKPDAAMDCENSIVVYCCELFGGLFS